MGSSEAKQASGAYGQSSHATLEDIVSGLPFPAALNDIVDTPRRVLLVNQAFTDTFGYDICDCPTVEDWARLAYPEEDYRLKTFQEWDAAEQEALKNQGPMPLQEVEVRTKDGRTLNVMLSAQAIGAQLVVAFIDISVQRKTEAELRNVRYSLERTAYELTENLPVGTYTMLQPPDGGMAQFRFLSKRFLEISGLPNREIAFTDPRNVFVTAHPEDLEKWVALNEKTFAERIPFYGEKRIIVNGQIRWISAESNPRQLPDGSTLWEGVLTDITNRKLAEESLARAKTRAEELERIKTEFLTRMSHEIRTPLTMMLGLTDLLADDCDRKSQSEKVAQLRNAGNLLLGIVNDILDLSKIEAGQLITEEMPFELKDLLPHIQAFEASIGNPELTLNVQYPVGTLPTLIGDQRRIEQVLGNLIGNAIKFTERGRILVMLEVNQKDLASVCFKATVSDTGKGIDPTQIPELFTPFMQGDNSTARQYGGTGLGLSISKELVELMGGRIGVQSVPNQGSHFWFELPLAVAQAGSPPKDQNKQTDKAESECASSPATQPADNALSGLNILVVDDSLSIRGLMRAFLLREGAKVELAASGAVAVEILQARGRQFDCVLMDVQMPQVDGLSATRQIRQITPLNDLPILAMTAGLLAEQQVLARQAGMADVIAKPVNPGRMVEQILKAVGKSPQTDTKNSTQTNHPGTDQIIPSIPGINHYHANQTMDGNLEMFDLLVKVFVEEFEGLENQMRGLIDTGTAGARAKAKRLAHSLRGSAKQLGALNLSDAALALEEAIDSNITKIDLRLHEVIKLHSDLIACLQQHLSHNP